MSSFIVIDALATMRPSSTSPSRRVSAFSASRLDPTMVRWL
jgi:hypothetical protein